MQPDPTVRPVTPEPAECVLLSDGDGTIRWASPSTADVFDRDPETIRRTETIRSLLGPDAPEPHAVGSEPVSHTLTASTGAGRTRKFRVTVESEAEPAITIYRCRRLDDHLTVEDVLARVDDAVVALDAGWHYTYVNDAAEALLEHDDEALLGEYVWDVFPEAKGTPIHETMARAMASQESATIEWYSESDDRYLDVRCFPSESGISLYFRDVTERTEREKALRRERDLVDQLLSVSPTGIAVHAPDGRFVRLNERAEAILGIDGEALLGEELDEPAWVADGPDGEALPAEEFPLNVALRTGEPTYGTELSIRRPDGTELWLSASAAPLVDDAGEVERVVVTFEDISERKRDERRLADKRDELQRLNRINELIREVNRAVVGATDRESIETAVCAALHSESYPVALITRHTASERMQVSHAVGIPADVLATLRVDGATCLESSLNRASTEPALTVLTDLRADPAHHESVQSLAATHDIHTLVNIPLVADGVVHGVLTVGARDDDAFSDRERSVLLELGELIGSAIDAIQTKKLLHASGYQELTLAAGARDAPLVELQERLDRRLTLDGVVPVQDGRYLLYLAVDDVAQSAVETAADGIAGIETARFVDSDRRPLVELAVGDVTAVSALLDAGGQLQNATVEDGIGEFVVGIPPDTDVRAYLDLVEQRGVDMGLLAKRDVERTARVAPETATDGLTARQRTVLEAAYRSGYFDWPRRRTTGEALADSLDIASSTLHQHLRVATRKALDEYFEVHAGDTP